MNNKNLILPLDIEFLPSKQLTAGDLELMYEAGRIRYIHFRGKEILRMIYPAIRDENWTTIKGRMENESVELTSSGFIVRYSMNYNSSGLQFKAQFEITGEEDRIVFVMEGEALSDFKSKRIGLCVHHPIEGCAGHELQIIHPEGKTGTYIFPELISPVWPFTDILSMKWNNGYADAELNFEGDLFETEDQRNWTDNSYKTYSGPQYKTPMLEFRAGDRMKHRISFHVRANEKNAELQRNKQTKYSFPAIGYNKSNEQAPLTDQEINMLKQVPFNHYRVDLHLSDPGWPGILKLAALEADLIGTVLELALFLTGSDDVVHIADQIAEVSDKVQSILLVSLAKGVPEPAVFNQAYDKLKQNFPHLKVGYGSSSWFANVHGSLDSVDRFDFVGFLVSPQVHQDDSRSILENLGSQHTIIDTLKHKIGDIPVHVSPVVFNSREDDPRLHTTFGAWWTVNAIHNFAGAGHITLYEVKGPRGIISTTNGESPVFALLKTIKEFSPAFISLDGGAILLENENERLTISSK